MNTLMNKAIETNRQAINAIDDGEWTTAQTLIEQLETLESAADLDGGDIIAEWIDARWEQLEDS